MSAYFQRFRSWLSDPVDGQVLGLFRLLFGLFMVYYTLYYYRIGFITEGLLKPKVLFKYDLLDWIPLFPAPVLFGVLILMGVAAALMAAGVLFRWACWIFSLCLAYFFFQEKSYYNNHIYLFILLPLLLSATHADRFFSLRSTFNSQLPTSNFKIPRWQQFILQAQIVIVYFYAGIVKFKPDWLFHQEPMQTMIRQFPEQHWMAPVLKHDVNIWLFTYGGFFLDLLAPLLLWYKPLRNWAWIPFVLFHLANSQIFDDISIFPFVMLCAMVLFFYTDELPWLRDFSKKGAGKTKKQNKGQMPASENALADTAALTKKILIGYFVFQILFPFRGFFLPNALDYTTIGNRFAWRVKADTRMPEEMTFTIEDPQSDASSKVDIATFLNPMQIRTLATDPRVVRDFARYLKEEAARQGMAGVQVKARIRFGYNGRAPGFFIDPEIDLAGVGYSPFRRLDWVMPLPD